MPRQVAGTGKARKGGVEGGSERERETDPA